METIPKPEILNPDRVDRDDREDMTSADHRSRWQLIATALDESCQYGQQLWDALANVRTYLVESLPTPPGAPGSRREQTAPTRPDDEEGWTDWMRVYASVTSVLAGAHGDSGYGEIEANQEAQMRRTRSATGAVAEPSTATGEVSAPAADDHTGESDSAERGPAAVLDADPAAAARRSSGAPASGSSGSRALAVAKPLSLGVLITLALRGLRPRRAVEK